MLLSQFISLLPNNRRLSRNFDRDGTALSHSAAKTLLEIVQVLTYNNKKNKKLRKDRRKAKKSQEDSAGSTTSYSSDDDDDDDDDDSDTGSNHHSSEEDENSDDDDAEEDFHFQGVRKEKETKKARFKRLRKSFLNFLRALTADWFNPSKPRETGMFCFHSQLILF
jgi:hypothetical protein